VKKKCFIGLATVYKMLEMKTGGMRVKKTENPCSAPKDVCECLNFVLPQRRIENFPFKGIQFWVFEMKVNINLLSLMGICWISE